MLWLLALVGLTATVVAAYSHLRRRDPAGAEQAVEVLRQVTTALVVLSQAVITALEALARPSRPFIASGDPRGYRWTDFDD